MEKIFSMLQNVNVKSVRGKDLITYLKKLLWVIANNLDVSTINVNYLALLRLKQ